MYLVPYTDIYLLKLYGANSGENKASLLESRQNFATPLGNSKAKNKDP